MSKPENTIQNIKENRKQERERLRDETYQLKNEIKGNPKVIEAIEKLERRVELLEDKVD